MNDVVLAIAIALAGGLGSVLRYLVDHSLPERLRERFPWGTTTVNLTGSLALGLVTGYSLDHPVMTIVAVGLLGGYTTFSTASLESIRLVARKRYVAALLHGPGVLIAGTMLAIAGIVIASR